MSYVYRGAQPIPTRKKSGPKPKPFDPAMCGTRAGYKQHARFHEERCQACRDADAAYQRARRARKAAA